MGGRKGPLDGAGIYARGVVHFVKHVALDTGCGKPNTELFQGIVVRVRARHYDEHHFVRLPIKHTLVEALLRSRRGQATCSELFEFYFWIFAPEDVDHDGDKTRGRRPMQSHGE